VSHSEDRTSSQSRTPWNSLLRTFPCIENFRCCGFQGQKVVNLWGGVRNKKTGELWEQETMAIVWSATKGLSAMTGTAIALDGQRVYARNFEVPSGGGIGTARAIAHGCGVFATGRREQGLRPETLGRSGLCDAHRPCGKAHAPWGAR
jgi:hypothetical protein